MKYQMKWTTTKTIMFTKWIIIRNKKKNRLIPVIHEEKFDYISIWNVKKKNHDS